MRSGWRERREMRSGSRERREGEGDEEWIEGEERGGGR